MRIEFFEDLDVTSGVDFVLPDGVHYGKVFLGKTDDTGGSCVDPDQEIEYEICFRNDSELVVAEPFIIDWLPDGVAYPGASYSVEFDPNDPNIFTLIPPDPGYNEEDHSYVWYLDQLGPTLTCVQLPVIVRDSAPPGGYLHNYAELWGTVTDANGVAELRLLATAELDTPICCYIVAPEVLYVDRTAIGGANSGLDWENAFTDLQPALEYAKSQLCGDVNSIYVAQGTYSPGSSEGDSFDLTELPGISLYGGFPKGGCAFENRNPKKYETILSGKIDQFIRNDTIVNVSDDCLVDGFIISEAGFDGQCVFGSGVNFSLRNCTIADSWGYGIRAADSNVNLSWCTVQNNLYDGISHSGAGFMLNVENSWFKKQGQYGINCENSMPILKNSIVTESDLNEFGNAGIRMFYPSSQPVIQNCTVSHNNSVGISVAGTRMPSLTNCIVYHNNDGGQQLSANLNPDTIAQYCCIADCNEVNNNINDDPNFAYFDPNNVRIKGDSPCHDSGLTVQEHYSQVDMDKRDRVLGYAVDRGAYEIECDNTTNALDWNADGIVGLAEFTLFSEAWLTYDPNCPHLPDPVDPNQILHWKSICDLDTDLDVDLADLAVFFDEWCWKACWGTVEEMQMQQILGGGEQMQAVIAESAEPEEPQSIPEPEPEPTLPEPTIEEQILGLQDAIAFLEQIWLEEPDIQQQISPQDWQAFMDSVYQSLSDLQQQ